MKTSMMQTKIGIFIVLLLCAISCKTTKETAGTTGTLAGMSNQDIFQSVVDNSLKYQTLSGRLNVNVKTSKKSIGSNASIKMIRNERIQLSFQPFLGYEAFRMELTPDSILFVDRFNKRYAAESFSSLKLNHRLDFNFYNLQAVLANQLFLAGKTDVDASDYKSFTIKNEYDKALMQTDDNQNIQYVFTGDALHKIRSLSMSTNEQLTNASLVSVYDKFQQVADNQTFPMLMNLTVKLPSNETLEFRFNYSKVELDKNLDVDFSLPTKYQRLELNDIIKMINSL